VQKKHSLGGIDSNGLLAAHHSSSSRAILGG
jgi:hypothetical protein